MLETTLEMLTHWVQQLALNGLLPSALEYPFVIRALFAALLIGPLLGAIGTTVVAKRMAFFSSAIGNASLAGIAIGIMLNEPLTAPYVSLFSFALLFAIYLNYSKNRSGMSNDTLIGVFLATSLAVGSTLMLAVTRERGLNIHTLDKYLFGDILSLVNSDLSLLIISAIIALGILYYSFNKILLTGLNPSLAKVRGVPVTATDYLFVILIALITVASVKVVGAVLVEALLVIPAAAASNVSRSLKSYVINSILFALGSAVLGVMIPAQFDLNIPSGGAIIIAASLLFIITLYIRMLKKL